MVFAQLARLCFVVLCTDGQCPANAASSDSMFVVRTSDSTVVAACDALAQRRAWRATRLLEPVLADAARRTPDVVLLAATAAAEWQGWSEVARLLEPVSWIDTVQAGRGRVLLARAALERGLDSLARVYAEAAVGTARGPQERARRTVILARALDRLAARDSARDAYVAAARGLPEIADWLYLRAAALTPRRQGREALYEALATAPAKARAGRVEAQALEALGSDLQAAARAYEQAGLAVQGLRLRALAASSAGERAAVRRRLIAIVAESPGGQDARDAVAVLDERFPALSGGEQLLVARSLAVTGPFARAATLLRRAFAAGRGTATDRYTYATVLRRLGRHREAVAQLARIAAPRPLAADAALLRARSLLELDRDRQAARLLRAIPTRYPRDTAAAAGALYLLADLATDARRDGAARETMLALAKRYPTSTLAPPARLRAALIAFIQRRHRTAAVELDTLIVRHGRSSEANAALYWAGRAWERAGDRQKSQARWRELVDRDPLSYYAAQAARRLDSEPWAPPPMADAFPHVPVVDSTFRRADILTRLGMESEARLEYDYALHEAGESLARLLATADAFRDRGLTTRSIQLGWKLLARGERDARTYRLIYPIALGDAIVAESRQRRVDPGLVAAIIRQESSFNPRATSVVGARGLMQVMPAVGEAIARSLGYQYWSPDMLYEPEVNLQLGVAHLRAMLGGRHVVRALAAYNAGDGRVARWSRKPGVDDPEVFVERIPFAETRDYVRIVLRNRDLYRALYRLGGE